MSSDLSPQFKCDLSYIDLQNENSSIPLLYNQVTFSRKAWQILQQHNKRNKNEKWMSNEPNAWYNIRSKLFAAVHIGCLIGGLGIV